MKISLILTGVALSLMACASKQKNAESKSNTVAAVDSSRPILVKEKKNELDLNTAQSPVKGKFLDYIYEIQPDHKQPGYTISRRYLNNGYAHGSGPYDGWLVEFFLFRGNNKDYVVKQTTGWEVKDADKKYGALLEVFQFENKKKTALKLGQVWPVDAIDALYEKQINALKAKKADWNFHRLVRLPVEGTTTLFKVCEKLPEPPFATETDCATIGQLRWNKEKFELKPVNTFDITKETI